MSATPRKVVQLTPYYAPHIGGVEKVAEALARGLASRYDVEVWTTDRGATATSSPPENFPVYRLPAVEIAHTPLAPGLARLLFGLAPASVVHVHVAQALWPEMVALAAARRDFTVVAHFHLDVDPSGRAGFLLPAYKRHCLARVLRRADAVVALTPGQGAFLIDEYGIAPDRVTVVPNGVDDVYFQVHHNPAPDRPLRLLFVGRLDRQKNVPRLLGALGRVERPVEVVIVGDGEDATLCRTTSRQLRLDHVRFVGVQHGAALVAWYAWADIFVLPSDREGMPLAVLEAMAAGLGVLTTDVSDLASLVGEAGLVVPPRSDDLAAAISRLAADRLLVADLQARSRRRGRTFGWPAAVDQVSDLYESLPA